MVTWGGNAALFDQPPGEVEIGLGGGGKADLDLGEADGYQQIEEAELLFHRHGPFQGLIAVAQVHAGEQRGPRDAPVRPSAVRLGDHRCGRVLAMVERSVAHVAILWYWGGRVRATARPTDSNDYDIRMRTQ
jgi:hypothetical protein